MSHPRRFTVLLDEHPADPGDIVIHDVHGATSRATLESTIDTLHDALARADLGGRTIGVSLPNSAIAVAAWFAIWRSGGTVVPLNPRVPDAELDRLATSAKVEAVLTTPGDAHRFPPRFRAAFASPVVCLCGRLSPVRFDEPPALVQFTSGTSGPPKPVPLTHDRVLAMLDAVLATLQGRPTTHAPRPNIIPVSLSLWAGIYNVLFALRVGAAVVLMDGFDTIEFARLVQLHGITSSILPPAAMVMLTDDDDITALAPLRYVRSVTAPLSPRQARRFHDRFGIAVLNGYGQTELGGEVIGWSAADWRSFGEAKLGSIGRPHAGVLVRSRAGSEIVSVPGTVGELEVRTSVRGSREVPPTLLDRMTDDGWIRTGDLGHIDEDGFVWVDGRVSAMINRGGLKIHPDQVEEVLRSCDAVADVAVVGVSDERLGEVPVAFIVTHLPIDTAHLIQQCRNELAAYKVPVRFFGIDELPRNEIGKLLRGPLIELASEALAHEGEQR